jgi:hypothetical protein
MLSFQRKPKASERIEGVRYIFGVTLAVILWCQPSSHRPVRACARPSLSQGNPPTRGDGSWAEPFSRRPIGGFLRKGSRLEASPSGFRPPPPVPGLFWFRARVILLPDRPTRPIQRLPVRGRVPTFPHPEPPLLFFASGQTPLLRSAIPAWPPIPATIAKA